MSQLSQSPKPQSISSYDEVPVHLKEHIQPHGVLLVVDHKGHAITKVSQNSQDYLKCSPRSLIGQPLSSLLDSSTIASIEHQLAKSEHRSVYQRLTFTVEGDRTLFDTSIHQMNESIILELEPAHKLSVAELTSIQDSVTQAIAHIRSIRDITNFLQAAVEELQALTGYDRVMIYQFDAQQAGSVVAETQTTDGISYLGLHYPSTDIPKQIRKFYQQGMVRLVPNLSTSSVPLIDQGDLDLDSTENPLSAEPTDLSRSILRAVDSCCVDYHRSMDVSAFLVIALVNHDSLWGLIACHHSSPKPLPYPIRSACETLGQMIAAEVTTKIHEDSLTYLNSLKTLQSDFVQSISEAKDFKQALIHPQPRLLDLVNAKGAAVCLDQDLTLVGDTPNQDAVDELIKWSLTGDTHNSLFHTDCLSTHYPAANQFKDQGSGVLILTISKLRRYLIIWFRPEVIQTVTWAGDPATAIQTIHDVDGGVTLGPRASFEQWKETVEATSLPWKEAELENALDLKNAIVGIVLNKADELAQINLELARSNRELDSFAYAASHDLKEPLRGITNFSNIIVRRYATQLDETGVRRLKTLVQLAQRMDMLIDALLEFSRLGQTELNQQPTDLDPLLQKVIDDMTKGWSEKHLSPDINIPQPLPTVCCDPVLISNVFRNLISNAVKYTDEERAEIEIGWRSLDEYRAQHTDTSDNHALTHHLDSLQETSVILYIKDSGIGIQPHHFQNIFKLFKRLYERDRYGGGSGVGLTITQRIIERHKGHIWVESIYGKGTTFYFTLR